MYAFLHVSLLEEKQSLNLIQIEQTWCHSTTLFIATRTNFIISMVTELQHFLIRTRINVLQFPSVLLHKE